MHCVNDAVPPPFGVGLRQTYIRYVPSIVLVGAVWCTLAHGRVFSPLWPARLPLRLMQFPVTRDKRSLSASRVSVDRRHAWPDFKHGFRLSTGTFSSQHTIWIRTDRLLRVHVVVHLAEKVNVNGENDAQSKSCYILRWSSRDSSEVPAASALFCLCVILRSRPFYNLAS